MLYINDELVKEKPKDLFKKFQDEFSAHLDPNNRNRINDKNPVIIKYVPSIIKPMGGDQKLNKGKFSKPRCLYINHVATTQVGDSNVHVRYTQTAPRRPGKDADLLWADVMTDVPTQISTTDIDLVFFFWAYSKQNVRNNEDGKLMIENKDYEIELAAKLRRNNALLMARLWNDEKEGGSPFSVLYEFARTRPSIRNLHEIMDKDEKTKQNLLRTAIEQEFTIGGNKAKEAFLEFTQPPRVDKGEYDDRLKVIEDALEHDIIAQVNPRTTFNWKTEDGKVGEVIWSWKDSVEVGKPPYKLYVWLSKNQPELLEKLKALTEEKIGAIA